MNEKEKAELAKVEAYMATRANVAQLDDASRALLLELSAEAMGALVRTARTPSSQAELTAAAERLGLDSHEAYINCLWAASRWGYFEAIDAARSEINAGRAICYATGYTRERGRYVELQTDQGWNPEPFWTERESDTRPMGNDDTLGD